MQIEQIDRDAAAPWIKQLRGYYGHDDNHLLVQAFARHRIAALSARPAVGEDVVERVGLGDLPSRMMGWAGKARLNGQDCISLDLATVDRLLRYIAAMGGEGE